MKQFVLATVLALCASAASAATVTLDFDSYAEGTVLAPGSTAAQGVSFADDLRITSSTQLLPSSPPNAATQSGFDFFNISGSFVGAFSGGVDFISLFAGDSDTDLDTIALLAFDALNVLVDSDSFTGKSAQTLSVSGAGIVSFAIQGSGGRFGFDDFTFRADAVTAPEPAAFWLLGIGLLGLAKIRSWQKGPNSERA